ADIESREVFHDLSGSRQEAARGPCDHRLRRVPRLFGLRCIRRRGARPALPRIRGRARDRAFLPLALRRRDTKRPPALAVRDSRDGPDGDFAPNQLYGSDLPDRARRPHGGRYAPLAGGSAAGWLRARDTGSADVPQSRRSGRPAARTGGGRSWPHLRRRKAVADRLEREKRAQALELLVERRLEGALARA